mmetsp:Transcript_33934/g.101202  ORF Transcript_33934/g.101202 Transcript_33934/m.101202 type:complete len:733 (-) Transcript_33934:85-2283(-)
MAAVRSTALWFASWAAGAVGVGKKPLFEYDDHYVMLNDRDRNEFYRRALARVVPACGEVCSVLDVGAGSGLLSIMAASLGASHVLAIEANPDLAALAEQTIARNQPGAFPGSNVTVVAELSSRVGLDRMPLGQQADVLVTETFGTMLLGEGAIGFVPDARERLLREGGKVIPAGGCQYVTLVEAPDFAATLTPGAWAGLNLSRLETLQDNLYWKASVGASRSPLVHLTERLCVLELDLQRDTRDSVPENRTFRIRATHPGTVHAALFDWDVWADAGRDELLSTASDARSFSGDVAWGQLLQLQEEADEDWQYSSHPRRLRVETGDWLEMGVEFIARGISLHVRVRRAPTAAPPEDAAPGVMPPSRGPPMRMRGVDRAEFVEANEFLLPLAGDAERLRFYDQALDAAVARLDSPGRARPTVLDCSGHSGVPALSAAKRHGLEALVLTRRSHLSRVVRELAEDNGVGALVEAYGADPRDLLEPLLPQGRRADIVVLEPPGTPVRGLSPFALLPSIRKHLLREDGMVVPAGGCLEAGIAESADVAELFAVPGGHWGAIDLSVWNEEARRHGVLERLVPYTKWFGSHSRMSWKWLSAPTCIFEVDLSSYGRVAVPQEDRRLLEVQATEDGKAHAILARWVVWDSARDRSPRLGAEGAYLGRSLTWPTYVQALAAPGTEPGLFEPHDVQRGQRWGLEVTIRQGAGKVTGTAGPEFSLSLRKPVAAAVSADGHPGVEL